MDVAAQTNGADRISQRSDPVEVLGVAWTTALGDSLHGVWEELMAGNTGIREVKSEFAVRNLAAATLSGPLSELTPTRRIREMSVQVLRRVLSDSGISADDPRLLLVLGTSLGAYLEGDGRLAAQTSVGEGAGGLGQWAEDVAAEIGARRAPISLSTACSSGSDAILLGAELIRAGVARICVCGGADVMTMSKRLAHSALGTMSPDTLRAFDAQHNGTLLGEGAAFIVLGAVDAALGRPLARLRGVGSANDAAGMTAPNAFACGARLALERAMSDAGALPHDIAVINAHGSATILNDATEMEAYRIVFAEQGALPVVFATKGAFGHTLGATGAIEAISLILAIKRRQVPPIVGLTNPDPAFPLPLAFGGPRTLQLANGGGAMGLSLTLGFGGFDTCLLFEDVP